ncbi:MAG: SpoIID/LytB domain-containing protein [bacterium]|nr:SpoIID/LytB domain-containing protein [bacterium]
MSGDTARVLILEDVKQIELGSTVDMIIYDMEDNIVDTCDKNPIMIQVSGIGFAVNGKKVNQSSLKIVPVKNTGDTTQQKTVPLLIVNGKKYRGEFRLYNTGKTMQVVNVLDIEEYLCGVVPREMPFSWHIEALKAQAVAARTFTYNRLFTRNARNKNYDLLPTIADQVYGGYTDERESCNLAIAATCGEILVYNDKPIYACYHGNSGGQLEDNDDVFGGRIPYLCRKPDKYAVPSATYHWSRTISAAEIRARLHDNGLAIGTINDIELTTVADSGRVREITIVHSLGKTRLSGPEFRNKMGTTCIRSTLFTLEKQGESYIFRGTGSGHGVGMSQWSAKNMAEAGKDYQEILAYFYPGTTLINIHNSKLQ